jgi:hypothetical protein
MREFRMKLNWDVISRYQQLSESFMEEFQCGYIHWDIALIYQTLSKEFIEKNKFYIYWHRRPTPGGFWP